MQIKLYSQINPIHKNFYPVRHKNDAINPNFKDCKISKEVSEALRVQRLAFLGNINETKEITPEILHKKFVEQANDYTLNDIKEVYNNIIKGVQEKGINVEPDEVKYTMGLLTQFAGVKGIIELAKTSYEKVDTGFFRSDAPDLTQFVRYLQVVRDMLPEEKYDKTAYEKEDEERSSCLEDFDQINSCIKHMQKYKKNLQEKAYDDFQHVFYFGDKKSIEYLSEKDKKKLLKRNPIILYPTGWDRGITFLDPQIGFKKFETNAIDVIVQAKKKYPNEEFSTALNRFLNEEASDFTKAEGLSIEHFISITPNDKKFEFDDILNNLQLQIPTAKKIETVVDSISEVFEKRNKSYSGQGDIIKSAFMKYFYNTFNVVSPKSMAYDMRELYKKIEESLPNGKSMNEVKIIMPDTLKSSVYIVRQFASVNNIDPKKIEKGEKCKNLQEIQQKRVTSYPYENDVILSIDDNSLSGTTIAGRGKDNFGYGYYPINSELNNTYIFGRIYATDKAKDMINGLIQKRQELHSACQDKFISVRKMEDEIKIPYTKEEEEILDKALDFFCTFWGKEGFCETKANVIFPMTAPDNNSGLANFLALQFYPNSHCVKELTWNQSALDEILQKIKEKEE